MSSGAPLFLNYSVLSPGSFRGSCFCKTRGKQNPAQILLLFLIASRQAEGSKDGTGLAQEHWLKGFRLETWERTGIPQRYMSSKLSVFVENKMLSFHLQPKCQNFPKCPQIRRAKGAVAYANE